VGEVVTIRPLRFAWKRRSVPGQAGSGHFARAHLPKLCLGKEELLSPREMIAQRIEVAVHVLHGPPSSRGAY